jgi:hypothetical protein
MAWKNVLREYCDTNNTKRIHEAEDEDTSVQSILGEIATNEMQQHPSLQVIPRFWVPKGKNNIAFSQRNLKLLESSPVHSVVCVVSFSVGDYSSMLHLKFLTDH